MAGARGEGGGDGDALRDLYTTGGITFVLIIAFSVHGEHKRAGRAARVSALE